MRVFISYSLSQVDRHIANLLAQQAQARGFLVDFTEHRPFLASVPSQQVSVADVVIAIVSKDSQDVATVRSEVQMAVNSYRPVIALVESGSQFLHTPGLTLVEFDRYNPGHALTTIDQALEAHRNKQNLGSWIVAGGLAVLALYLLSSERED